MSHGLKGSDENLPLCIVCKWITAVSCPEAIDTDDNSTRQARPVIIEQAVVDEV